MSSPDEIIRLASAPDMKARLAAQPRRLNELIALSSANHERAVIVARLEREISTVRAEMEVTQQSIKSILEALKR